MNKMKTMLRMHHISLSLAAAVCILLSGCIRELCPRQTGGHIDHADVMLNISTQHTKAGEDYYGIRSIRIYAYRHGETDQEAIGYAYFPDIDREGPYLCPVQLGAGGSDLEFPCEIDFIVLLNDDSILPEIALSQTATIGDLDQKIFSTVSYSSGVAYVPMCNERIVNGDIDSNNFSFTVNGTPGRTQIIPIDVKRCVSRLTLNLTKDGESDIFVKNVTLKKGPQDAPLILNSDVVNNTSNYYSGTPEAVSTILDFQVELVDGDPLSNDGTLTDESLVVETCLLPNPYGSEDPDSYKEEDSKYNNEDRTYRLEIEYTIIRSDKEINKTKTVYLPLVKANNHIQVYGTISDVIQADVDLNVIVNSWTLHKIDVPPFE